MNLTEGLWITNPLKIFSGASDRTTEDWQDPSRTLGRMRSYHYLKALSNQHSFYLCFLVFSTACSHTGFPELRFTLSSQPLGPSAAQPKLQSPSL